MEEDVRPRPPGPIADFSPSDLTTPLLWDLDGTLVDTSRDLATAINALLAEYGYGPLPLEVVIGHVGKGARNLVARCLGERGHDLEGDPATDEALSVFDRHYAAHIMDTTAPYPGIPELLWALADSGRRMAVVSNKPEGFSRDILESLGLSTCFTTVVGGDTLPTRKPDPGPLLHALRCCDPAAKPGSAVMIGDTWIDVEAARAAGMASIGCGWGLGDRERARASAPDAWAGTVSDLHALLLGSGITPPRGS